MKLYFQRDFGSFNTTYFDTCETKIKTQLEMFSIYRQICCSRVNVSVQFVFLALKLQIFHSYLTRDWYCGKTELILGMHFTDAI